LGDNGDIFTVAVIGGNFSVTSLVASLSVTAQTNPPVLIAAAYNPVAQTMDLYFDDVVSSNSADNAAAYTLNDPDLSIAGVTVDIKGYLVSLSISGAQSVTNLEVSLTNVADPFNNTNSGQTMPVLPLCWPASNVVADAFQQGRLDSLEVATNGVVTQQSGAQVFETFFGPPIATSFVGLTYPQEQVFKLVKVDLGATFVDGGDWAQQPQLYILKNNVDTDMTEPQTDPTDWLPVAARLITGNVFQPETDVPAGGVTPNSPVTFDLTGLSLADRAGFGWAVGGVPGNGFNQFLSVSELSSFQIAPLPPVALVVDRSGTQAVLSWPQAGTGYALESSPTLGPSAVWTPVPLLPQGVGDQNVVTLPILAQTAFYRLVQ
jgi:hypothetical protein